MDLGVFTFNKGAIRCYEKADLTIEGTFPDAIKMKDTYWSTHNMGILEDVYRKLYQSSD